jgi:hypothetical protein
MRQPMITISEHIPHQNSLKLNEVRKHKEGNFTIFSQTTQIEAFSSEEFIP